MGSQADRQKDQVDMEKFETAGTANEMPKAPLRPVLLQRHVLSLGIASHGMTYRVSARR
jgi:hypothetical protein